MNPSIVRLYVLVLGLFVTVVGFTSYWSIVEADELSERPDNRRSLIEAQQVPRGTITTVDGTEVAVSVPRGSGDQRIFVRDYPQGALFGHPVGYSFVEFGNSEIERSENDVLIGRDNEFVSIIEQLEGQVDEGSDLTVTLDVEAQQIARDGLQSAISIPETGGALVAIEPDTGAVRAMVSEPGYDPNLVPDQFKQLNRDRGDTPLVNRPTQSVYPPGSTMKVVTATAALDSGEFEPSTTLNANSGIDISGVPLANAGGEDFGTISMTDALTNSVNTYWAQVGEQLGTETMVEYMERFGFYSDPPLDFPSDELLASGVYNADRDLVREGFDVGRVAIGQGGEEGQDLVTPLQMAQVAAAVANGGELMEPTFLQEVTDPDGRTTEELDPDVQSTVMSEETAAQVAEMMTNVAEEGTASGLSVAGATLAGKTGTAELDLAGLNQAWFIGFAPADDPQIAVAATVEKCQGCFGGDTAGPIATDVMASLLEG
ncbi:MAG TPA: penicillin-binding protein 2 [Solirubrobacterales bacterium]|jgi:peptidoglycan glycosyltransferase|nr:penicillin-binding protein 2 [Solirubrobacterales bacterium]